MPIDTTRFGPGLPIRGSDHREVAAEVNRLGNLSAASGPGAPTLTILHSNAGVGLHLQRRNRGWFLGRTVDAGPNSESDYTDERYWVRGACFANTSGTEGTERITFGDLDGSEPYWLTATNFAEVLGSTHSLPLGTPVALDLDFDEQAPGVARYFFKRGIMTLPYVEINDYALIEDGAPVGDHDYDYTKGTGVIGQRRHLFKFATPINGLQVRALLLSRAETWLDAQAIVEWESGSRPTPPYPAYLWGVYVESAMYWIKEDFDCDTVDWAAQPISLTGYDAIRLYGVATWYARSSDDYDSWLSAYAWHAVGSLLPDADPLDDALYYGIRLDCTAAVTPSSMQNGNVLYAELPRTNWASVFALSGQKPRVYYAPASALNL